MDKILNFFSNLTPGRACMLAVVVLLSGCESIGPGINSALENVDYGCATVELDGYFTDSRGNGRVLILPEGETLTNETIEALCN